MERDFLPALAAPPIRVNDNTIRFLLPDDYVEIDDTSLNINILWQIIGQCNGHYDIADIAAMSHCPEEYVKAVIDDLVGLGVIVDSRELFMQLHQLTNFPASYTRALDDQDIIAITTSSRLPAKEGEALQMYTPKTHSQIYDLAVKRSSCRAFTDQKLSFEQITGICFSAYNIHLHTVPSAGGLFPLKFYVLVEEDQIDFSAGYYEYNPENQTLIRFGTADAEQLKYCFNSPELPFGSTVQIIIAADLLRESAKYSNRGYRFTLLEAGHSAENICLYCAETGLATCELGGTLDEPLRRELEIENSNIYPLLTIAIGYSATDDNTIKPRFNSSLLIGDESPITDSGVTHYENGSSFFAWSSYIVYGKEYVAGATSPSSAEARFKAEIEGYERWVSSRFRADLIGPANSINAKWLDPRTIAPLAPIQIGNLHLAEFKHDLVLYWREGERWDGTKIFVPTDLVYYGIYESAETTPRIYRANSSGIAAFPDMEIAKKKALVELVERDAIMRNWFSHDPPQLFRTRSLPIHLQKRASYWKSLGRKVYTFNLPSVAGTTFLVAITSNSYPHFVCGAAATIDDDLDQALYKAFNEAEYALLTHINQVKKKPIQQYDVKTPEDHGQLYCQWGHICFLEWLWTGNECIDYPEYKKQHKIVRFDYLSRITNAIFVDISVRGAKLKVVRAISPELVPISFGFDAAHYTHKKVDPKTRNPFSITMPHYFA